VCVGGWVSPTGSGGGIDVLLGARRVGPTGRVFGLDMTGEMLALARENARRAGVGHVEFLQGEIEQVPLPDGSVDVIISNCAINLSSDKRRVLAEVFRVLKPGGRLAVSDIVVRGEVTAAIRRSVELWIGWVAGRWSRPIVRCSRRRASRTWTSSRGASTGPRTRGQFSIRPASTSTASPGRWTAGSPAPSSGRGGRDGGARVRNAPGSGGTRCPALDTRRSHRQVASGRPQAPGVRAPGAAAGP
jgi:protein-L-isoaspartate O-methyltransferase